MATKQTLTVRQVIAGFGVGHMTVYNWRQGTKTKDPLPCTVEDGRVSFETSAVKAWAKKYDLPFDPNAVTAEVSKPGPKAKAAAKKAPAKKATAKKAPVKKSVKAKMARAARRVEAQAAQPAA